MRIGVFGRFNCIHLGHAKYIDDATHIGVCAEGNNIISLRYRISNLETLYPQKVIFPYHEGEYNIVIKSYKLDRVKICSDYKGVERFQDINVPVEWVDPTPNMSATKALEVEG